jgi:uncharacterized protein (DUF2062 family)
MGARLRRIAQILLHVEDSPHRTALAFAVGVWIAFFPLLGIHTALALVVAMVFRLSRVAVILGAYLNNPWTLAPLYSAGTLVGCLLLQVSPTDVWAMEWSEGWVLGEMLHHLRPILWPFVVGNLVLGTIAAGVAYVVVRGVLARRAVGGVRPSPA